MREEAFGPVRACFPNVEECQGADMREGGWEREQLHGSKGKGREIGVGRKGISFKR